MTAGGATETAVVMATARAVPAGFQRLPPRGAAKMETAGIAEGLGDGGGSGDHDRAKVLAQAVAAVAAAAAAAGAGSTRRN